MKKLISLVLILCMACMLIPALADGDAAGVWYVKTMKQGEQEMDMASVGMTFTLTLNADGTCAFDMAGDVSEGTWSQEGDTVTITIDGAPASGTMADGLITLSQDSVEMVFSQEAPAALPTSGDIIAAESEEAFFGTWQLASLDMMGQTIPVDMLSSLGMDVQVTMTVETGKATMAVGFNGQSQEATMSTALQDGKLSLVEGSSALSVALTESGNLAFELPLGETSFKVVLAPAATGTEKNYKTYKTIDWKGVSRYPDKFEGQTVQFTGYVLQVIENEFTSTTEETGYTHMSFNNYGIRVATKGKYDDVVYVILPYEAVEGGGRLLDGDKVTIYGTYDGLKTYTTVLHSSETIPQILGEYLVIIE